MIQVFVPGDPKPQPRPRAFARGGHAAVYDPGTAEGWKGSIALALKPWAGVWRAEGGISVALRFVLRRPASHYRKRGGLTGSAPTSHTSKPDVDNLAKAALDCCTTLGLWRDDGQVDSLFVTKRYQAHPADQCGVELTISTDDLAFMTVERCCRMKMLEPSPQWPDIPDEETHAEKTHDSDR